MASVKESRVIFEKNEQATVAYDCGSLLTPVSVCLALQAMASVEQGRKIFEEGAQAAVAFEAQCRDFENSLTVMSDEWLRSDRIMNDIDDLMKTFDVVSEATFLCPEKILGYQVVSAELRPFNALLGAMSLCPRKISKLQEESAVNVGDVLRRTRDDVHHEPASRYAQTEKGHSIMMT